MTDRTIKLPDDLYPETADLVADFAAALGAKLSAAQKKYGYSTGWLTDDWQKECLEDFHNHVAKGDARDIAIYAAFMWRRGWAIKADPRVQDLLKQAIEVLKNGQQRFSDQDAGR